MYLIVSAFLERSTGHLSTDLHQTEHQGGFPEDGVMLLLVEIRNINVARSGEELIPE